MATDPIRHVVVLMLENRSFDQMLGDLRSVHPNLDGINPSEDRTNFDEQKREYRQEPIAAHIVDPDPKHDLESVLFQIGATHPIVPGPNPGPGRFRRAFLAIVEVVKSWIYRAAPKIRALAAAPDYRGRFVERYSLDNPNSTVAERKQIMAYFPYGSLPALHALAEHFMVCDHWFASVPGPTWANRFFVHSGTSLGIARMPDHKWDVGDFDVYDQATVFDRLNERGLTWKVYYHDHAQSMALLHQWQQPNRQRYCKMDRFDVDAAGPEGEFPRYCFIEPRYFEPGPNDYHPPHDSRLAQELIARVYNAIRDNKALWEATLLVILYDEHGGFYDHVEPPAAISPDERLGEYSFDRLGVRVPAILVSPWVKAGVFSAQLDHTSLLRYLTNKCNLGPLTRRVDKANDFSEVIRTGGNPRSDTPPNVSGRLPGSSGVVISAPKVEQPLNEHQEALILLTDQLESKSKLGGKRPMRAAGGRDPHERAQDAVKRFEQLLTNRDAVS